ncbi:MAG: COP23 domain-containing protein [Cyanobacteria bacterium J06639_18]
MRQNLLYKLTAKIAVTSLTVLSTITLVHKPIQASSKVFECGTAQYQNQEVPTTFAYTQDGRKVMVIRWVSKYFSRNLTNRERCNVVSNRFQRFYDHGILKYLNGGRVNKLPVVCAVSNPDTNCTKENTLYTLKTGSNPYVAARTLLDRRGLAGGNIQNESSSDDLIIDFNMFLRHATDVNELKTNK